MRLISSGRVYATGRATLRTGNGGWFRSKFAIMSPGKRVPQVGWRLTRFDDLARVAFFVTNKTVDYQHGQWEP